MNRLNRAAPDSIQFSSQGLLERITTQRTGFSVAEMMMVVVILAIVLLGIISLDASFTYQMANFKHGEQQLNRNALVALATVGKKVSIATRIDSPTIPNNSDILYGGFNVDSASSNNSNPLDGAAGDTGWFIFCVSAAAVGACQAPQFTPPCLWMYEGTSWPPPRSIAGCATCGGGGAFTAAMCGTNIGGGSTLTLLSGMVTCPSGPYPTPFSCFSRDPNARVPEANQVRAYFIMNRAKTGVIAAVSNTTEGTFNGQFGR